MTLQDCIDDAFIWYNNDQLWKDPICTDSIKGRNLDEVVESREAAVIINKLIEDTVRINAERLQYVCDN